MQIQTPPRRETLLTALWLWPRPREIPRKKLSADIEVDGNLSWQNIPRIVEEGAYKKLGDGSPSQQVSRRVFVSTSRLGGPKLRNIVRRYEVQGEDQYMTNIPFSKTWGDRIKEFTADFLLNNHLEQVYLVLKRLEYALAINTRAAIVRRFEGSTDVLSSPYRILKSLSGPLSKSVLFVTYHPQGYISEHVKRYIAHFKLAGCSVILVKIVDDVNHPLADMVPVDVDAAMVRKNGGYDFGAWAHALKLFPEVYQSDALYFVNDSVFGPLSTQPFLDLMTQIENADADLIGLTQCYQNLHHYQSYFLVFRNLRQHGKIVKDYWDNVRNLKSKQDVIFEYEHGLKRHFSDLGLKCDAIYPILKGFSNPSIGGWKKLLDLGYPFVKVSLFRQQDGVEAKYKCREVIEKTGYDMSLINQHIDALAKASSHSK